jgi:hypothetical protein
LAGATKQDINAAVIWAQPTPTIFQYPTLLKKVINKRYDESNGTAGANKIPPTSAGPATKDQNAAVSRQEATESHKVLTNPTSSRGEGLMIDICWACPRKETYVLIGPSIGTIEKKEMESTVGITRYSLRRNRVVEINTEFLLDRRAAER